MGDFLKKYQPGVTHPAEGFLKINLRCLTCIINSPKIVVQTERLALLETDDLPVNCELESKESI
jgi:hypothetical protein